MTLHDSDMGEGEGEGDRFHVQFTPGSESKVQMAEMWKTPDGPFNLTSTSAFPTQPDSTGTHMKKSPQSTSLLRLYRRCPKKLKDDVLLSLRFTAEGETCSAGNPKQTKREPMSQLQFYRCCPKGFKTMSLPPFGLPPKGRHLLPRLAADIDGGRHQATEGHLGETPIELENLPAPPAPQTPSKPLEKRAGLNSTLAFESDLRTAATRPVPMPLPRTTALLPLESLPNHSVPNANHGLYSYG
ncbi:hypothetical protein GGS20DRAFT_584723 [Poronia punctata]|nr:hypothetical protein GGS20DRAFT_584723 [Poronia punctata]